MNFKNCYMVREGPNSDIRKLLIEAQQEKITPLGSNFYEITLRKKGDNTYDFVKAEIVTRPFEYFQELIQTRKIKRVYPQELNIIEFEKKLNRLFYLLKYTNEDAKTEKQEFNYNRNSDFFKLNGIDINSTKRMRNYNKRDK